MRRSAFTSCLLLTACFTLVAAVRADESPNPEAVFCSEQGGIFRVVMEPEGERGVCLLVDGGKVDAWDYFREHYASPPEAVTPDLRAQQTDGESMTSSGLAGGWTRQDAVSEDAQAALDWVLAQMNTASGLRGIRGVWTQVVAGVNYAIEFELYNDEVWHTVVFRDLNGRFHLKQPAQLGPRLDPYEHKE